MVSMSALSKVQNLFRQICSRFFGLQIANFCHFSGLGLVREELDNWFVLGCRLDRQKNGFADQQILSKDLVSLPEKLF